MYDKMNDNERWVTIKEICEYLSISRHTLMFWINKHGLPAHKIGGTWRMKISEVDKWVESFTEHKN